MKKKFHAFLAAVLILTLSISDAACAELMHGSGGEEVVALQMMLFDMGYLFEEPDGRFGARTETAVKEYQKTEGLEETGMVTDDLMARISQDWADYQNWIKEQLEADAEDHGNPYCCMRETEDGQTTFEYCERHALLWDTTFGILMSGDADSALYSYYEWQLEVIQLYNEWISLVSAPVQAQIEVSKALCIQLMEAHLDAIQSGYDEKAPEIDPRDVYCSAELWMRMHCAWICQMMNTLGAER